MVAETDNIQLRKRGRPRKNQVVEKVVKKETKQSTQKEKEIILRLPLHLKDIDLESDDGFTKKKSSDDNGFKCKDSDTESCMNDQTILTISDDESDDVHNKNYHDISRELSEKDKLIRKLKDELLEYKSMLSDYNTTTRNKDTCVLQMNIPIVGYKDGKQIIAEKTNIACFWCTHTFETMPCYIPERYHDGKFYVYGCFCTYNCALAYNLKMGGYGVKERHSLIIKMYNTINENDENLVPAERKEILEKYGGPVNIFEYRKNLKTCDKEYRFMIPPMVSIIPTVETIFKEKMLFKQDVNKFIANEEEKPTTKNKLFDSMGIKMKVKN
jgi:hypothetical protein